MRLGPWHRLSLMIIYHSYALFIGWETLLSEAEVLLNMQTVVTRYAIAWGLAPPYGDVRPAALGQVSEAAVQRSRRLTWGAEGYSGAVHVAWVLGRPGAPD